MKLNDLFLAELESEADRSKRALERMPEGKHDWKPHDKSMIFGYLCELVATIPLWIALEINQPELDIAPKDGSRMKRDPMHSRADFLKGLEKAVGQARDALKGTTDEHLQTPWRLLAGGNVVMELPRHVMIRDTLNHLAHHRGQMTVYLRLLGAPVPALYGPSADDKNFG